MADDDRERPSLELPSFRLGRKRKQPPTAAAPAPPPTSQQDERPVPPPEPSREPESQPAPPPEPESQREVEPEPEREPVHVPPAPARPARPGTVPAGAPAEPPSASPEPAGSTDSAEPAASGPRFRMPAVSGPVAAVVTGVLVGIIGVGLVWGSTRLCELVRGVSSCGAPGAVLLLAVVVVAVLLGKVLLDAFGAPEPLSTSVLGVGVTTVVTLLFLGAALLEWWMVIAVPLIAAAGYALSHWVTTAVVGPIEDNMHR